MCCDAGSFALRDTHAVERHGCTADHIRNSSFELHCAGGGAPQCVVEGWDDLHYRGSEARWLGVATSPVTVEVSERCE